MTSSRQPRLLIIDDDERIMQYLQLIFTKRGYAVYLAQGSGDALRENSITLAKAVRPHVAIVDLRLDDYNDEATGLLLVPELDSAHCVLYSAYLAPTLLSRVKRQYNVFDWADKQDIAQLYAAVDEAAAQMCASQSQVEIHWPVHWPREEIITALFAEMATPPTVEILDDILIQLFRDHRRIMPVAMNEAANDLRSVVRGRSVVAKIYPDQMQPLVLKLGHARRTRHEYTNYQKYIHNRLPGLFHTQIEEHTVFWDLGGTLYSFVGADRQALPTFAQYYAQTADAETILTPLRHLFQNVWRPHYQTAEPMAQSNLFAAYNEIFNLQEKLTRIPPALFQELQQWLAEPLCNPVAWIAKEHDQSSFPAALQAVTHGDLHGDNLFVENGHAWLIDFERTGPSHALRDFAELEVDIFARLLPQTDWPRLHRLALTLVAPPTPGSALPPDADLVGDPAIDKAIQVIAGVRQLANEVIAYAEQREYLWAILFDALFVASVTSMPTSQRQRALLYASVICGRLAAWPAAA
ncbi:MAG: phosphotransferase [Caldilineaceae bacterium]|nr:phosphotransferase [Caldilineaceae bacterium]